MRPVDIPKRGGEDASVAGEPLSLLRLDLSLAKQKLGIAIAQHLELLDDDIKRQFEAMMKDGVIEDEIRSQLRGIVRDHVHRWMERREVREHLEKRFAERLDSMVTELWMSRK